MHCHPELTLSAYAAVHTFDAATADWGWMSFKPRSAATAPDGSHVDANGLLSICVTVQVNRRAAPRMQAVVC